MKIHPFNKFGRLENLSRKLEQVAQDRWGVTDLQAPFIPLMDLNLGDLGTDYPIRVAAALRRPAAEIGVELSEALKGEGIDFLVYEGFLNIRLGNVAGRVNPKSLTPFSEPMPASVALILQHRSSRESRWGMFRRAALLGLQALLIQSSKKVTKLCVLDGSGNQLPNPVTQGREYWLAVKGLSEYPVVVKKQAAKDLSKVVISEKRELTFLWAAEEIWNQTEYKSLQSYTELLTQFGSAAWLEDWGDERECRATVDKIILNPVDTLFVMSDTMRGSDLDGTVLGSHERANLRWYCKATAERINDLIPKGNSGEASELFDEAEYRQIVLRATFIADFLSYGAQRGQLWGFLEILREMLDGVNRIMNNPNFRQKLAKKEVRNPIIDSIQLVRKALETLNTGS